MDESATMREVLAEAREEAALGIPVNIIHDLIFRILFNEGDVSLGRFADVIRVHGQLLDKMLQWMQNEHLVDIASAGAAGRLSYVYSLTEAGEKRARDAFDRSQYIGPAPVPIESYNQAILLQTSESGLKISPAEVQQALSHLILPDTFHRRVGPAVNAGSSLFLYGPPGNGKTAVAQSIAKLIGGSSSIWLPYAVSSGGYVIQVYDRIVHTELEVEHKTAEFGRVDKRWGFFERPAVMVGGELTMEALDLRYDEIAKFYEAPLQLKANGGMFLIDDFGRQQISPTELLNRWIVPLESGIDFLRLQTGQTLEIPFRQLIVFSTNLDPGDLVDDAFLRRIQMKVSVNSPDDRMFYKIFTVMCESLGVKFDKDSFVHLLQEWYRKPGRALQAVHPRDILKSAIAISEYEGTPMTLTPQLIDEACESYFVSD